MPVVGRNGKVINFSNKKSSVERLQGISADTVRRTQYGDLVRFTFNVRLSSFITSSKNTFYKVDVTMRNDTSAFNVYKDSIRFKSDESKAQDYFDRWKFNKEKIKNYFYDNMGKDVNFTQYIEDMKDEIDRYNSFEEYKNSQTRGIGSTSTSGTGK